MRVIDWSLRGVDPVRERFRNRSDSTRHLHSSIGWGFIAQTASKAAILAAAVLTARLLTTAEFGLFAALMAALLIAVSAWDLGIAAYLGRSVSADEMDSHRALSHAVRLRLLLFPVFLAVFVAATALSLRGHDEDTTVVAAVMFLMGLAMGASVALDAIVRSELRFRESAMSLLAGRSTYIAILFVYLIAYPDAGLLEVAIAALAGEVITLLFLLRTSQITFGREHLWQPVPVMGTLRSSAPFAANGFFNLIYNRADVLLVALLAGSVQAGLYAPASRMQDAVMLVPAIAVAGLVQVAARAGARHGKGPAEKAFLQSMLLSLLFSIPLTVILFLLMPAILPVLLGSEYTDSVRPAQILIWAVPIAAVEAPILSMLIAQGHARLSTLVYAGALLTALVAQLVLTPQKGAIGAAIASFSREPVALVLSVYCAHRVGLFSGFCKRAGAT